MSVRTLDYVAVKALIVKGHMDVARMKKNAKAFKIVNDNLLFKILKNNANSEYGKKYDFASINSVEEYQKRVPICEYNDLSDDIDRIYEKNEQGIMCSDDIIGFAKSSGSIGKPKVLPKTQRDVKVYSSYTVTRFLALADEHLKKTTGKGLRPARGICLLAHDDSVNAFGLPSSNVADIAERKYEFLEPHILILPLGRQFVKNEIDRNYAYARFGLEDENCSYLFYVFAKGVAEFIEYIRDNWQLLVSEIETGTLSESVFIKDDIRLELQKKIKPNPRRASELRAEFEKGFDETILKRIWPNLSVISTIGTSVLFEGFTEEIKKYSKGIPIDYSIYGASEGLMAAGYEVDNKGQILLTDSCYYEFLDEEDENAEHILNIDELEIGKKYEIILTNQSGFYRYRIKDVIEVVDFYEGCPVIDFVYRKGQLLNITGEKTNLEQMQEVVKRFAKATESTIDEWAVFVEKGESQYRYVLVAENSDGKDLTGFADKYDEILIAVNPSYKTYRDIIGSPRVLNQKPGTHAEWKKYKESLGAAESQIKPVRNLDTKEKQDFFLSRVEE